MAQFRPGSDPLGALARALAGDGVLFRDYEAGGLTLAEIIDTTLRMSKLGLIDIYEQARLGERVNLLVVVDQFEELFRYRQLGAAQKENAYGVSAEAVAFVNLLLEVREQTSCSIYVILTMRSDFLGDCAQFPGLPEAINAGQYLVPRLTRDERRAAISGPVGVGGAEIAPVLLTRLVNDVGDNPDQLSILQHALNRTWACWQQEGDGKRALDLTHYDAIGTMAHALDQHAENAYAELGVGRQQQICEKLFKALTDKATDPRGVRRPTTQGTLCALAVATAAEVTEVIDVFREPSRSFLMPPAGEALSPETVVDISHESLMRVWERLQAWADAEAQSARLYRRLAETAMLHEAEKASLWRDPDLQLALDWQTKEQPTAVWAARYHEGFEPAMRFLQASVARRDEEAREQEARRQEQEAQRQRAPEQAHALAEEQQRRAEEQTKAAKGLRRLLWIAAALTLIAVGAAAVAVSKSRTAQQQTRIATSRQLAAQALSRYVRLDLALLSSLEANHITDIVETRGSLLDGLQRSPHLTTFLTGHTNSVRSVAFSPDSKILASGSWDKTLILWDVASRQPLGQPLTGHTNTVRSVAFSPDGRTLASGSDDNTLILWDVASRQPLGQPLTGHTKSVVSVAFSPDGKILASGSDDNTLILWDVSLKSWQDRACRIANRNLTRAEWKQYIGDIAPYRATCPP
jgi:predicted amidohydrolase